MPTTAARSCVSVFALLPGVLLFANSCSTTSTKGAASAPGDTVAPPPAPGIESFTAPYESTGSIERLDPALDNVLDSGAPIEVLARGFKWSEGPVWVPSGAHLLFTDVPANTIYRWKEGQGVSIFMQPSGGEEAVGPDAQGANGLALDAQGRLVMCQHGSRRIAALDDLARPTGSQTGLADRFDGKRFSSPNDLVVVANGDVFFTDPPYGLPKGTAPETPANGVYRRTPEGKVTLVDDTLERPNGIGFSPDGRTLYVANSHRENPIWKAYDVAADGSVSNGRVFFDASALRDAGRDGGNDGLAVDANGNLFATGPGGVLVLSPQGKHLGTILTGHATANCKFGDDGGTLYVTAHEYLLRVETKTKGLGF